MAKKVKGGVGHRQPKRNSGCLSKRRGGGKSAGKVKREEKPISDKPKAKPVGLKPVPKKS